DGPVQGGSGVMVGASLISPRSVARQRVVKCYRCVVPRLGRTTIYVSTRSADDRKPETLDRSCSDRRPPVHAHPERPDRELRPTGGPDGSRRLAGDPGMSALGLRDALRPDGTAGRWPGGPPRPPAPVHGRSRPLLAELAAVRPRMVRELAHRVSRAPGTGRRV